MNRDEQRDSSEATTFVGDPEQQPLLGGKLTSTPLPKLQLAVVCCARLAEPIAYTQIFPYINQMVEELGVVHRPEDIGFYSGLVDSSFAVAQLFTIYQWGKLSDRIGRKPVVIIGLGGVTLASLLFGLSKSFWHMMFARGLAGALTGNVAVVSTIVADITDSTNEGKAFPLPGVMWATGCILGPLVGGMLSHPAERYPSIFGSSTFLRNYPFFLPCLLTSVSVFLAVLLVCVFLEESHPRLAAERQAKRPPLEGPENTVAEYSAINPVTGPPNPQGSVTPSTFDLLKDRNVFMIMLAGFFLDFNCIADRTLFVLWSYSPIYLGGLDRTPREIGITLSSAGSLNILVSLIAFPILHKRFGTYNMFVWPAACWPVVFTTIIVVSTIAKRALAGTVEHVGLGGIWGGVAVVVFFECMSTLSFGAFFMMIKAVTPNPESLGAMFGLATTANCIGEAIGPALASSIYAATVEKGWLGGNVIWLTMIGITTASFFVGRSCKRC